jgi:2-keto-4-pentenoate hydratase/2-oxohepta-3-ene-1,7-dioic acid hydratase in catechol pathway/regulator of RNase E activity RraA
MLPTSVGCGHAWASANIPAAMIDLLSAPPSKIIALHTSYRSRAIQRGGTLPAWPSYFLKPPSSLTANDHPVARPPGCDLLAFEGEVALVIGSRASRVRPEAAWGHVAWVTAANDFGVYDLRYADRGGNVRSKGIDGLTPLGPRLLDARDIDPAQLRVRTWKNGELVQDARLSEELLFGFDDIIADLTRLMTLEPGDVILTGTPAGSTVVRPGDVVDVEVTAAEARTGRLRSPVVEADYPLPRFGAMPRITDDAREAAFGGNGQSGSSGTLAPDLSPAVLAGLGKVSTATLASQLRKRGLNGLTMDGLWSTRPSLRMVGFARTLRYLPLREDLFARYGNGMNAQKQAIDQVRPGDVLVIDARQERTAGTIGDILALRAQVRGAVGIVTDGAIRDAARLAELNIPTYHAAVHPAVLGRRHVPWEQGVTVACAGVTVQPGDLVVGDGDGVVVLPPGIAADILADARTQESEEDFISSQIAIGAPIDGLYPLEERWRSAYQAWLREQAR